MVCCCFLSERYVLFFIQDLKPSNIVVKEDCSLKVSPFSPPQLYQTSKTSDDEDYEGKAWLRTSKSFDNLTRVDSPPKLHKDKKSKSKTPKFITRIFKRKSVTPASLRRGEKGGKSVKARGDQRDSYRDSYVSTASSVSESRERCLTASMSMPDISSKFLVVRYFHF